MCIFVHKQNKSWGSGVWASTVACRTGGEAVGYRWGPCYSTGGHDGRLVSAATTTPEWAVSLESSWHGAFDDSPPVGESRPPRLPKLWEVPEPRAGLAPQWPLVLALLSGQAQHSVVCSARLAGVRWSLWVTHALPQMPFWGPRAPGPRAATPVAPELQRPASRARGPVAQACLCPTRGGSPALPLQGGPGKATVYCLQGGPWALSPSS